MYKRYIDNEIYQRFVRTEDATFIHELRTNSKLSLFLSATNGSVGSQIKWIEDYKNREHKGQEFYFITENNQGEKFGVNRIYNISGSVFEIGSWLFRRDSPSGIAILSDISTREYGFNVLNLDEMVFQVRKENKSVINYHKHFFANLEHEDNLNYYFRLNKKTFNSQKNKILKVYGKG
jgi:RimJ/RimL family protein N-acetyltransferase